MAESYIQVPTDGTGKRARTHRFTIDDREVHHQIIEDADFAINYQIDSGDPNISYVGKALAGSSGASSVWQIKRIDETTGTIVLWADGDTEFNNVWNDRETLSYS